MEISTSQIEQLRDRFLQEASGNNSFHPKDLDRVKSSNHWLERFLKHNDGDEDKALAMMIDALKWRNDFKTNDITEDNIKMDILVKGGLFIHGMDIDNCHMIVFKCKLHTKGSVDMNDLKRVVIYWFERMERLSEGNPITIFFDMESCGLGNMDMEFTKYLINLFKQYYPYFLNYIIIFEMPWILSAAFKVIKTWLPEKAVEKIKFVSKKDIKNYVPLEHALKCWGGDNPYTFNFVSEKLPEENSLVVAANPTVLTNNRKVHFSEDSAKSEVSVVANDKDGECKPLKLTPGNTVNFVKDGGEYASTLELQNIDPVMNISYKIKTTSPEKFRVKPNTGCLVPGNKAVVTIILMEGYQIESLKHDKFLVLSMPYDSTDMSPQKMSDMWKNMPKKKIREYRLKCQSQSNSANSSPLQETAGEHDNYKKLSTTVAQLTKSNSDLQKAVQLTQYYQMGTIVLCVIIGVLLAYLLGVKTPDNSGSSHEYCTKPPSP